MKTQNALHRCLATTIFIVVVLQISSCLATSNPGDSKIVKPANRTDSVRTLVRHLGLGEGSTIADIGAGRGRDTWVFADIVGTTGTVVPEEIEEKKVQSLKIEAEKRDLSQVKPVLGRSDDPCLPTDSVDLVYMNHVYHHFAKPRAMLRGIWRGLKPGGYLTIVDQRRGTLRDWVERSRRETRHYWIAETTVVREAREEGFAFVECAEPYWHTKDDFVLVFQRPENLNEPGHDPDPFPPINVRESSRLFRPVCRQYRRPVFIALGQARDLIAPILENSTGEGLEIVLEEWATQKDEREPLPPGVSMPSVLTQQGDPNLPDEPIDAVFFLDSYHLLFHGKTLLAKLNEKLLPTGRIYILDRRAKKSLSRREASHRRMIESKTVKKEMTDAGFYLWSENPHPAPDRFLLVFGKTPVEKVSQDDALSFQQAIGTHPPVNAGFLIKDGKPLFPIGCYELPKNDAELARMIPKLHEAAELIRSLDKDKRQIWINEAAKSDLKFVRQYIDNVDITGCDIYPVNENSRKVAVVGDATERWKKLSKINHDEDVLNECYHQKHGLLLLCQNQRCSISLKCRQSTCPSTKTGTLAICVSVANHRCLAGYR